MAAINRIFWASVARKPSYMFRMVTISEIASVVTMMAFLVSRAGLGYLIVYGSQVFNMDLVMTSVLLLLVAAVVMYRLVLWVEKLLYRVWGLKA